MRKLALILLLLVPVHVFAQGRKDDIVLTGSGRPAGGATIAICTQPATTGTQPCSPLATVYTDSTLGTACTGTLQPPPDPPGGTATSCSNPMIADGFGNFHFYAANGTYTVQIYGTGLTTRIQQDVTVGLSTGGGSPGGPTNASQVNGGGGVLSGTLCVNYGNLSVGPTNIDCDMASKGPNPYVDIRRYGARAVNTTTTPAAAGLVVTCTSGQPTVTISSASTFVNGDGVELNNCGAANGMATPGAPTVSPALALGGTGTLITTTTVPTGATTYNYYIMARNRNGGTTALSAVGSTSTGDFALGAKTVNIATYSRAIQVVTATTLTYTLSQVANASGGTTVYTGTFSPVPNVGTCALFAGFTNSVNNGTFCVTAANATTVTANNPSGVVETHAGTMQQNHGFFVGCTSATCGEVFLGGGNGITDTSFRGWYLVTGAADAQHFTMVPVASGGVRTISIFDTTLGATSSATGGTATWYSANHITWSAVAGSVYLGIYSDRAVAGTCALIGVSLPLSAIGTQDNAFDDFGSPMMDNFVGPDIFPTSFSCASPPAPKNNRLVTTISSGAGSTSLTLAANAGNTNAGTDNIRLDSCPAILAAANTISATGYGTLTIPSSQSGVSNAFVVNSWCLLPGGVAVGDMGPLFLNDTIEIPPGGGAGGGAKFIGDFIPQFGAGDFSASWSSNPRLSVNQAHPGLFFSGGQFAMKMAGINCILASLQNDNQCAVIEGGFDQAVTDSAFASSAGSTDYMNTFLYFRASPGQGNSNVLLDRVGFTPGGGGDGVSHTPTAYFRGGGGNVMIPNSYSVHRGMQYSGNAAIQLGVGGVAYINGGGTPLVTLTGQFSSAVIGVVVMDTIAHPVVAAIPTGGQPIVEFVYGNAPSPSSGVPPITGNAQVTLGEGGVFGPSTYAANFYNVASTHDNVVFTGTPGNYRVDTFNGGLNTGNLFPIFVSNAPPSLNTCPVSAGGSVSIATHVFKIVPIWWAGSASTIGAEGTPSNTCTAVTSTGNQTVTLNWTAVPGNPRFIEVVMDGSIYTNHALATDTSIVISVFASNGGNGQPAGGPTELLPGVQGISTPALTLAGVPGITAVPSTVYTTASASTNASITATTMATAGANGNTYRFSSYFDQTVLGTSCTSGSTLTLNLVWTDPNAGSNTTQSVGSNVITNNGALGFISALLSTVEVRAKAGTVVQYSTTFTPGTGCSPAPSYQVYPVLEQLQ